MSELTFIFALGALFLAIKTVGEDEPLPRAFFNVASWICAAVAVIMVLIA